MTRSDFEKLVFDNYGVIADYPFEEDYDTGVFRHTGSRKWFALAMNISEKRLGLIGDRRIDVVNLKCAPEIIESLAGVEPGIHRAYHMNKSHWISVVLSACDDATVLWLLGISYELTRGKNKRIFKEI